ncbi:MAG: von Willebrand factor type [Frankiales bacterium]|nr:von Willebrand factor type [Frankiales bacterium]
MIPHHLTFAVPSRLLLLIAVAGVAVAYLWLQRRRAVYEQRFADADLLPTVMPRRPGWRRHLPATLMILGMAAMTTGFARPSADVKVPRESATVVVALDTSGSMSATDVSPSRLEAAKAAAEQFVQGLPKGFAVGLVSFNSAATVNVSPTLEHGTVVSAIEDLQIGGGTAIGDAVAASVQSAASMAAGVRGSDVAPVHIVLLSDGTNTVGRSVQDGVVAATDAHYPVSTIAYGTQDGVVDVGNMQIRVPVDTAALAGLAEDTGGTPYVALSGDQLKKVYDEIAQDVGTTTEHREITGTLVGLSLLTAFSGAAASLVLFRVLP